MLLIKNKKMYDVTKNFAQVVLPALGTLYFAIAQVWGLGHEEQIIGTIVAVDTFLGVVLHLSSTAYANSNERFDGTIDVTETEDKKTFLLNVDSDLDDLDKRESVVLKVQKKSTMAKKVAAKRKPRKTS